MATMGPILLPMLMLVAGCYCRPGSWLDIGGTVGYDSHINGTIGGHLKGERDGLSINGTGRGIIGASWAPTLIARGHAAVGEKLIAGDASLKTVIDNSWQPGFQGEIGRNSRGEWLLGATPDSQLYNKFMLTPTVQVKTGDDARKLIGSENKNEATQQAPVSPYGFNPYGYMPNPYGYMPNPYAAYPNMAPGANVAPNPYAAYPTMAPGANSYPNPYNAYYELRQDEAMKQAMAQSQAQQSQVLQSQTPEQPIEQEQQQEQAKA